MCDRVILVRAGHFNLGNIGNFQLQRCVRLSVDSGIPFARVCSSLFYIIECFIAGLCHFHINMNWKLLRGMLVLCSLMASSRAAARRLIEERMPWPFD